jgi:hypothetical protein
MQISMGILKNEHGVYLVRRKAESEAGDSS